MIDTLIFLSIGLAGVVITLLLYFTGEKKKPEKQEDEDLGTITVLKLSISIILILYLFRLIMMFFTGLLSKIYEPALVGGLFTCIPLILIGITAYKKSSKTRSTKP